MPISQEISASRGHRISNQQFLQTIPNTLVQKGFNAEVSYQIAQVIAKTYFHTVNSHPDHAEVSNIHVVPFSEKWAVISSDGSEIFFADDHFNQVLTEGRVIAKKMKVKLFIHNGEGKLKDLESFQVNLALADFR